MKVTSIYSNDGTLSLSGEALASVAEYTMGDRSIGSIFEAILPGEVVELEESLFELDDDLDLIFSNNSYYERADHRPGDSEDGDWIVHCRCSDEPVSVTSRSYYPDDGYSIAPTCPIIWEPPGLQVDLPSWK
jgi:hypothetical protein